MRQSGSNGVGCYWLDREAVYIQGANGMTKSSVSLAYEFVLPSYGFLQNRLDAVERRIEMLTIYASTLISGLVAIVVAASRYPSSLSFWQWDFLGAIVFFFAALMVGLLGRRMGTITLPDPGKLDDDEWLKCPHDEFMRDMLSFAGQHYSKNNDLIDKKSICADCIVGLVFVETLLLLSWIY